MEQNKKNNTPWWRDGVIVFIRISGYIAIPIVIALYTGEYLDKKYNTNNLFFLILITIAFVSTILLIWKEAKIYKKKTEKENRK